MNKTIFGDAHETLRQLAADGVRAQMCVTSPPYFGLRDYGHDGQIGLEATPDAYIAKLVEVFRAVRDVLADDGTLWLNIGDSYARTGGTDRKVSPTAQVGSTRNTLEQMSDRTSNAALLGLKPKDLIGIPWALAKALRDPYYTGPVKDVCDQVWLAAMMDAEGSICGSEYKTGDRIKTNIYITVTNTSVPVIEKCDRIFPQDLKHIYEKVNGNSSRKCFRWDVERMEQKALFLRTIYPHLVAKRKQAILGYTFIEMQRGLVSKKKGYLTEQNEQRSWLMQALSLLNSGQDIDIPDWCIEPPSLFEPGYYLRQDIIWHKPNPMPESVRDRCTKAHEYMFLLSKSERYYFDSDAIREPWEGEAAKAVAQGRKEVGQRGISSSVRRGLTEGQATQFKKQGHSGYFGADGKCLLNPKGANKRSVWKVATKPYNGKKALTDYVGDDGKPYTASPDCPIHGHLSRKKIACTPGYGERQDHQPLGNAGTDNCHAPSPVCGEQSTTSRSSSASSVCSSQQHTLENIYESKTDSPLTECTLGAEKRSCNACKSATGEHLDCGKDCSIRCSSLTAISRSIEASKMAHAPATNQPCMPCAENCSHTLSTQDQLGLFAHDHGTGESSILTGETSVHPSPCTGNDSAGKSSEQALKACKGEKKCTCNEVIIDHFATFPPALIEPCILAGSRPGDVVLDPFMGSGTTAQVAQQLGRQWIGCELNEANSVLQEARLRGLK